MSVTDANPPMPEFRDDYVLQEVDAAWLSAAVKPKQFIHIDQSECIMCEGCVDICPWKCIHMVSPSAIDEAIGTEQPGLDPNDNVIFTIDDDVLQVALVGAKFIPAEGRDDPMVPFGPVVDPGPDAPVLLQIAGWMGRDVQS